MLCIRTSEIPHVPSEERKCGKCGTGVWVSFASLGLAAEHGAQFICPECALEQTKGKDRITFQKPTPEQVAEIVKKLNEETH